LLIAYDAAAPEPLNTARPILGTCAVALVLRPARNAGATATLTLAPAPGAPETTLADPALERLRAGNPAARSLPLLHALATRTAGDIVLPMTPALKVSVTWLR
jgi:hypothetical protein